MRVQKIVGGANLCGLLVRNTMVGGYMRGKEKKTKKVFHYVNIAYVYGGSPGVLPEPTVDVSTIVGGVSSQT